MPGIINVGSKSSKSSSSSGRGTNRPSNNNSSGDSTNKMFIVKGPLKIVKNEKDKDITSLDQYLKLIWEPQAKLYFLEYLKNRELVYPEFTKPESIFDQFHKNFYRRNLSRKSLGDQSADLYDDMLNYFKKIMFGILPTDVFLGTEIGNLPVLHDEIFADYLVRTRQAGIFTNFFRFLLYADVKNKDYIETLYYKCQEPVDYLSKLEPDLGDVSYNSSNAKQFIEKNSNYFRVYMRKHNFDWLEKKNAELLIGYLIKFLESFEPNPKCNKLYESYGQTASTEKNPNKLQQIDKARDANLNENGCLPRYKLFKDKTFEEMCDEFSRIEPVREIIEVEEETVREFYDKIKDLMKAHYEVYQGAERLEKFFTFIRQMFKNPELPIPGQPLPTSSPAEPEKKPSFFGSLFKTSQPQQPSSSKGPEPPPVALKPTLTQQNPNQNLYANKNLSSPQPPLLAQKRPPPPPPSSNTTGATGDTDGPPPPPRPHKPNFVGGNNKTRRNKSQSRRRRRSNNKKTTKSRRKLNRSRRR